MTRMALQVKEVLPHVPLTAITRDLGMYEPAVSGCHYRLRSYFTQCAGHLVGAAWTANYYTSLP